MAELILGGGVDAASHQRTGATTTIHASDLTTHGVIVGMTGSGKTGLGVVLIEELLTSGVPALVIDPKGDLTNLALMFPALSAGEFRPWINEGDARTAGLSPYEYAAQQAATWTEGLASWGITAERIAALRQSVEVAIHTPGSTAGIPVNVVGSLQAPPDLSDAETVNDEVEGYVSGVLGLVGIDADPLSSREHILLTNLVLHAWSAGQSLDLATLIGQLPQPPVRKLGVFDVDQFFPPDDRMALAMRLNGLLASPAFAAWAKGDPLDIDRLLHTRDGRPRCAIVTTAHLSDDERQFVTTLLLAELVTWMRRQSGTTDLRALLYMDEVAGYLPPTANPPTKKPLMTLMKQARAFGVGVVLATQNPVDVDYKALSNAGTWMIGRLQTDRDKQRLLDGMSAASGGVDVRAVGDTISGLAKREFVLRRAGRDQPEVFTTRWAMSYLRGPLTREQIASLTAPTAEPTTLPPPTGAAAPAPAPATPTGPAAPPPALAHDESVVAPRVAAGVAAVHLDPAAPWAGKVGAVAGTHLEAGMVVRVQLRYDEVKADLVHDEEYEAVLHPLTPTVDPAAFLPVDYDDRDLRTEPPSGAVYRLPAAPIAEKRWWTDTQRGLVDHLVRTRTVQVFVNRPLKLSSRVGETGTQFDARCTQAAQAGADAQAATLRDKYEARATRLRDQMAATEDRVDVLRAQAEGKRSSELFSTAGSLLGGLLGGRKSAGSILGSLGSAAGRRGSTTAADRRVDAARNRFDTLADQAEALEAELRDDLVEIQTAWQAKARQVDIVQVPLERSDVRVSDARLVWIPVG
jgi:hypothetical protein